MYGETFYGRHTAQHQLLIKLSSEQQRCWSDCADAQADLCLCCFRIWRKRRFRMTWLNWKKDSKLFLQDGKCFPIKADGDFANTTFCSFMRAKNVTAWDVDRRIRSRPSRAYETP